jgi:PAS domain S-box-containing protein
LPAAVVHEQQIQWINAALAKCIGCSYEQAQDRFRGAPPATLVAADAWQSTSPARTFLRREDGSAIAVEFQALRLTDERWWLLVFRDVEHEDQLALDLQKTSQRLAESQRAAGIGSWELDLVRDEVWWSGELYRVFGIKRGEMTPTLDGVLSFIHPEDRPTIRDKLQASVEKGEPYAVEFRFLYQRQQIRFMRAAADLVRDNTGKAVRFVGTALDITEYRQLEDQLRHAHKMEAIGNLAGGVAHDFNNLLAVILGYVEMAEPLVTRESALYKHLQQIRRAGESASRLTQQLLAFGRRQTLATRTLDLREVVKKTTPLLERVLRDDVRIEAFLAKRACTVLADPIQLEQILLNLAINAQDSMPQGGTLRFELDCVTPDQMQTWPQGFEAKRAVCLRVRDDGEGMDAETQTRIFDPFFTTKPRGRGTGLGLSSVYGIVKQHQGEIEVASEPHKGTTFTVYLPASSSEPAEFDPSKPSHPAPHSSASVLVVEDDSMLRGLLSHVLEVSGYQVELASDPREAQQIARESGDSFDLLLTDIIMPGLNGLKLYESLRASQPQMQVIYMSGHTTEQIKQHGFPSANTAFLNKPFSMSDLLSMVSSTLGVG